MLIDQRLSAVLPLGFLAGNIVRPVVLRCRRSPTTYSPSIGTVNFYVDVGHDLDVSPFLARAVRALCDV